jgi:hypothetical protein
MYFRSNVNFPLKLLTYIYIYVCKLNQTVLELDFWAVKYLIFSRRNFQTYIIFSINLVSQVTLRSNGTDILYGCHLLRCLYNILYFLWLYNEHRRGHRATSSILKYSFNSQSVTLSRKENLEIDIRHVSKRV